MMQSDSITVYEGPVHGAVTHAVIISPVIDRELQISVAIARPRCDVTVVIAIFLKFLPTDAPTISNELDYYYEQ